MQLRNQRLSVEVAEPKALYRGARFDWSAFITQVTLDGKHTFCAPESLEKDAGSGGRGLCNEFGIFQAIGYGSTRPGEWFPKLGVGLLRRDDAENYDFQRSYALQPFPLEVRGDSETLSFQFEPLPCRGFEARLKKTLRLHEDTLSIEYALENVGTQPIRTSEYVHNFLALNGTAPGSAYQLRLRDGFQLRGASESLTQDGGRICWNSAIKEAQIWKIDAESTVTQSTIEPVWQLWHQTEGIGLSESLDCPVARMALWCAPHVVSPEVFVDIFVAPGALFCWTRCYQFTDKAEN